ncbi:MAG: sulfatase [Pirellulaceae bacterium]|nr:sulfatase [Pirellulaceae bacterium]
MKSIAAFTLLFFCFTVAVVQAQDLSKPDVVFIVVDDLNDWIGTMGGHPQSKTPNLDALAARGVLFTNAHCNAPQCGPSRTSLLHGLYPKSTGKYFNNTRRPDFFGEQPMQGITSKNAPLDPIILQRYFKQHGYRVVCGGKVAHGNTAKLKRDVDAFLNRPGDVRGNFTDDKANLWGEGGPHNHAEEETGDYKVARWAINEWNTMSEKPLLMTVGFYRPHRPFNAPKAYFEKFPLKTIQLPQVRANDLDDLPPYAKALARSNAHKDLFKPRTVHEQILHLGGEREWKYMVQSYLACINYVDTQIGRLLDELQENPRKRETVIVLTSDHGWNLGEKTHWCKAAIWRNTTRVPFIVVLPGDRPGGLRNNQPISHVDIYPSLCDFAGIPQPNHLEGRSILPLLQDPSATRDLAFLSYGPENTAAQSERYRYLRYEDGSEELYDHQKDPHEWTNLSNIPEFQTVKKKMRDQVLDFQER